MSGLLAVAETAPLVEGAVPRVPVALRVPPVHWGWAAPEDQGPQAAKEFQVAPGSLLGLMGPASAVEAAWPVEAQ